MAKKTAKDLKRHLCLFDPVFPIKKGYVARLMLDQTHADILKQVKALVQAAEPNKTLNEENLSTNLHRFKEILADKQLTCEWPTLIRFFLEPFPIAFGNFPILLDHLQPKVKSQPTSQSPMKPKPLRPTSQSPMKPKPLRTPLTLAARAETAGISSTPPDQSSTPAHTLAYLSSPMKDGRDLLTSAELQCVNMTVFDDNSQMHAELDVLNMPVYEKDNQWKLSLQKLQETLRKKVKAACVWKGKYSILKKTTKTARRKWKILHLLEEKTRTLEDELCKAQDEITRLNEVIEHLNSKLKKTHL